MLLDIFIFIFPLTISIITYYLSRKFNFNKLWAQGLFAVSFAFIFSISLNSSNSTDIFTIKNEIQKLILEDSSDEILNKEIPTIISIINGYEISDYTYSKKYKNNQEIITINYKEKIFNNLIYLQNRLYIIK